MLFIAHTIRQVPGDAAENFGFVQDAQHSRINVDDVAGERAVHDFIAAMEGNHLFTYGDDLSGGGPALGLFRNDEQATLTETGGALVFARAVAHLAFNHAV